MCVCVFTHAFMCMCVFAFTCIYGCSHMGHVEYKSQHLLLSSGVSQLDMAFHMTLCLQTHQGLGLQTHDTVFSFYLCAGVTNSYRHGYYVKA